MFSLSNIYIHLILSFRLWFSGYSQDKTLYTQVKALNAARKLAISKDSSYTSTASKFISQDNSNVLAISKGPLVTLLTNAGSSGSATWKIPSGTFDNGDVVDILTCKSFTVNGDLSLDSTNGQPRVLMAKSNLDSTLCSDTTDAAPRGLSSSVGLAMGAVLAVVAMMI